METKRLGAIETRFAELIWANAPLSSPELVRLCAEALGWKKSTTYTVLKKLCERGIFLTENATVTANISREEFYAMQSERFVDDTFDGSLPAFIAAFTSRKRLDEKELDEIRRMIDLFEKERK